MNYNGCGCFILIAFTLATALFLTNAIDSFWDIMLMAAVILIAILGSKKLT